MASVFDVALMQVNQTTSLESISFLSLYKYIYYLFYRSFLFPFTRTTLWHRMQNWSLVFLCLVSLSYLSIYCLSLL